MRRHFDSIQRIGLSTGLILLLAVGSAGAANIAWDMVNSTNYNLASFTTDAPVFASAGDGFQKYAAVPQVCPPAPAPADNLNNIPYALVDDSVCIFPTDTGGIINTDIDFNEFFGICDTYNDDNPTGAPYNATWVFDISAAIGNVVLSIDLAAMGGFDVSDFEGVADSFEWTYQVDAGPVMPIFSATVDENDSMTYTLANGTTQTLSGVLVVDGTALDNGFQTFTTPIAAGSEVTVVLTAVANGGREAYAARNIMVTGDTDQGPPPTMGGLPVPDLSPAGIVFLSLLMVAGGVFLLRRRS